MRIRLLHYLHFVALMAMSLIVGCEKAPNDDNNNNNGNNPYPSSTAFAISNVRTEHTKINVDIFPEDKDMEYVVFIAEVKHFSFNMIDTPEELFEDDYMYFRQYAEEFKLSVHDFLARVGWLANGDLRGYGAANLYPATDYIIYCYGVEFEGADNYTPITDIAYKVIRTTAPAMNDVTFDIETKVDGNVVTLDIDPNGYDGLYYHYFVDENDRYYLPEGAKFDESYIEHYRNRAFDDFNERINDEGYFPDDFCHSGTTTITERLTANTNYMVLCFAVSPDSTPLLCSEPTVARFTTSNTQIGDMSFEIVVSEITPYDAILDITPSTDAPYACVFLSVDQLPNSGDEFTDMDIIIEYYQPAILKGAHHEALTPLMPSTEYVVVAFGIEDNLPTSHMFSYRFTSGEAEKGKVSITDISLLKLYDAQDILAIDSSWADLIGDAECIAIVEAKTSAPTDTLYFWWYEEWQRIEYNDELFLEDLLLYDPANNPEVMQMWYSEDENDKFLFAGIAEDEDGNFSDIYYGDFFVLTKEMTSPAEEFFELIRK